MKNVRTTVLMLVLALILLTGPQAEGMQYELGVGDVLKISVWGHPELTTEVEVRPDGYITFPLVGDHWAVEKNTREISEELEQILANFVVNPQVTVLIHRFRTVQVQVLGEVNSTGYYQLKAGSRLMDVVALAGGPTRSADLSNVSITRFFLDALGPREQTEVLHVNAHEFITKGSISANPLMQNGDMIFVPASGRATIFGEVRQPTSYDLGSGLELLDLFALAGGALDSADLEGVILTRQEEGEPTERLINVQELLAGRGERVHIRPNDVVFVPKKQQVIVLGAVARPGAYVIKKGTRLVDILAEAGGVTPPGNNALISITRTDKVFLVDAFPSLTGKEGGENPLLQAGDLIFIPKGYDHALVLGYVQRPGAYSVTEQTRLLDLLAQAGGTLEHAGEKLILTRDEKAKEIELGPLERFGLQNERVAPGDVIYIPEGERHVLLLGEVRNPGYYRFRAGDRVLDAIGLAGGLLESAREEEVSLSRQTEHDVEIISIDFGELLENRYLQDNIPLRGGDVIVVPKSERNVLVLGEVQNPGYYQFKRGDGILDAVGLAGGLLESAREDQVSLSRAIPGGTEIEIVDFGDLLEKGYLKKDLALQNGDVVVVPKSERNVLILGEVRNPGYYIFTKGQKVLDLVGRAGGFTAEAEPAKIEVTREDAIGVQSEVLNLTSLAESGKNNPLLKGGEIISVPRAQRTVLVFGDVVRAGAYVLSPNGRLLDVLALAGGLQVNGAGADVIVTRQEMELEQIWEIGYEELLVEQSEHNLLMQGGDVVYVPSSKRQILVLGEVRSPGAYDLAAGARVMDAIALAGGPLERAALENVGIYRDGFLQDGEFVTMGKDKVLFTGDVEENPLLRAGDIIYVPETKKPNWLKIFTFVGGIQTFKDLIWSLFD